MTLSPRVRAALLGSGMAASAAGLSLAAVPWDRLGRNALDMLVILVVAGLLAEALARLFRWPRALALAAVGIGGFALGHGGAAGLLATAVLVVGGLAVADLLRLPAAASPWTQAIAGIGVVAAVAGWLLPFPLHFAASWGLLLVGLALWRRRALGSRLREAGAALAEAQRSAPVAGYFAVVVLLVASLPAWPPIRMQDDLGYHLALVWNLLEFGHARFDVGTQVWSLAPWSTDVLHGLVSVMAGGEVTGPLNVFWLAAAAWLVRELAIGLGLSSRLAWLSAMLYASLPISVAMTGGLQVEAASPAMLAALALAIQRGGRCDEPAMLRLCAVLAGFLMATKASHAVLLLPLFAWLLVRWGRRPPLRALPVPALLFVFVGGASYAYAWALTGNPLLPLFNHVFQSPWFNTEPFVVDVWQKGLDWTLPWRLVFDTSRYFEALPGAAGLVTLALLGGLAGVAEPRVRPLLLVGAGGALLMLWQIQYLRYAHPALALAIPALVATLAPLPSRWKEALLAALVAAQLVLAPTANWMHLWGAVRFHVGKGPDEVMARFVPERLLARRFRGLELPGDRVLFADRDHAFASELPGRAFGRNWYNPALSGIATDDQAGWARMIDASGANLIVVRDADANPALSAFLAARGAEVLAEAKPVRLYRLAPAWTPMASVGGSETRIHSASPPGAGDVLGEAELVLACSQPGQPVAIGWTLARPGAKTLAYHDWISCRQDGTARSHVRFALPAADGRRELAVTAHPAQAEGGMSVSAQAVRVAWRHDLLASTALYGRLWDRICRREGCGRDEAWITPTH